MPSCAKHPFFVTAKLEHSPDDNCVFALWCWMISSSAKLSFCVTTIFEYNPVHDCLFCLWCLMMSWSTKLSFLSLQYLDTTLLTVVFWSLILNDVTVGEAFVLCHYNSWTRPSSQLFRECVMLNDVTICEAFVFGPYNTWPQPWW